jgi:hypothetical protein
MPLLLEPDKPPGRVFVLLLLLPTGVSGRLPKKGGCMDIWVLSKKLKT